MGKYPEADKVFRHREDMQVIGDFLTWLLSDGRELCVWQGNTFYHGETGEKITENEAREMNPWDYHYEPGEYMPLLIDIEQWLADFFGIDRQKYEEEKMQMLEELRGEQ